MSDERRALPGLPFVPLGGTLSRSGSDFCYAAFLPLWFTARVSVSFVHTCVWAPPFVHTSVGRRILTDFFHTTPSLVHTCVCPPHPLFTHVCAPPTPCSRVCVAPCSRVCVPPCSHMVWPRVPPHVCGLSLSPPPPQGTVLEPVSYYEKVEGNAGAWGKAVATVDVSATRMMADRWCLNSYENKKSHVERQGADALREVAQTKDSHSMLSVVLVRFPNPVSNRVFATWFTWRKEPDDSFTIAFAPLEDFEDKSDDDVAIADFINKQEERGEREDDANEAYRKDAEELELMIKERMSKKALLKELYDMIKHDPVASQAVRGTTRGYWRIEPLAPAACRVTCLMQVELGGSIPTALLNARIFASLNVVQKIQVKFARNGKLVDKEMRDAFPKPLALAELSEEQGEVVESCRYLESEDGTEWEFLKSPSPFVRMSIAPSPANESERSVAIGKATAVVDCPALEAAGEQRHTHTATHTHRDTHNWSSNSRPPPRPPCLPSDWGPHTFILLTHSSRLQSLCSRTLAESG